MLAYAFEEGSPKRGVARRLVDRLDNTATGVASVQVLQELFVTLTRKLRPGLPPPEARQIVADLVESWRIVEPSAADVLRAIDNAAHWNISFWDAMLLTAANRAEAETLWSEDLNHGQTYGRVIVRNPFR